MFLLAAASFVMGGGRAWAGGYKVTYEADGPATWQNPDNSGENPYSADESISGGAACNWGHKQDESGNIVSTSGECHAKAKLTAHFVWDPSYPGEPPPKCAVVYETASAFYFLGPGGKYHGGSGNCASTLDHEVVSQGVVNQTVVSEFRFSYRYSIKTDPGDSFDKECTPTANAQGTGPDPNVYSGSGAAGAGVGYSAKAFIPELGLDGTTDETITDADGKVTGKNTKILIGQGVTASLSITLSESCTLSNWHYTIPGEIFSEFKVTRPDAEKGNVVAVAADENTKEHPHWHWKKNENAAVTVAGSADVTVNGEMIGNITAERQVNIVPPIFTFHREKGSVIKRPASNTVWYIGPLGTGSNPNGCEWIASAYAPSPFSGGRWHFVQIIDGFFKRTFDSGTPVPDDPFNGKPGLDSTYAYEPGPFLPGTDSSAPGGHTGIQEIHHGDSPYVSVNDTVSHLKVSHKFDVYLMYEPPTVGSQDVQWVPLHTLHWEWNTDVDRPTTWANPVSNLGAVTLGAESDFPPFPDWIRRVH